MEQIIDSKTEEEIYAGIYLLERYARLLLEDNKKEAQGMLSRLTELFGVVIPEIVASYDRPELESYRQDRQYWLNQLQRITEALCGGDAFAQIDVLYCETAENFREYLKLVSGKEEQT